MADDTENSEILGMSDEAFLNASPESLMTGAPSEDENASEGDEQDTENLVEDTSDDTDTLSGSGEEADSSEQQSGGEDAPSSNEDEVDEDESADSDDQNGSAGDEAGSSALENAEVDYAAEYGRILAPFKANGKEIKVDSIDDAITLMQQGANYNKKMTALAPNLKLLKMLENNDLIDEGKISYLIDLNKKNPEAISKLLKDSGINPLDIDVEKDQEYAPSNYTVSDAQMQLDDVLSNLRGTNHYDAIMGLATEWDEASTSALSNKPQMLNSINEHMSNGIYDQINARMDTERMLGRLDGLSDLDAYMQVGNTLNSEGAFGQAAPTVVKEAPKPKPKASEQSRKERKKSAAPARAASKKVAVQEINPLAMSDEEFLRSMSGPQ